MTENSTNLTGNTASLAAPESAAWRSALIWLCISVVAIFTIYWATVSTMTFTWYRSETFAHCFVVAPISFWLVWRNRNELLRMKPSPNLLICSFLFVPGALWLLGDLAAVNAATQIAFVGTLVLTVPSLLGTAVAGRIIFPLAFLFFAVPVGEFAMPIMMEWTARFTVLALRLTGVPVYQEGLRFVIPSGSWSVVEACSGIRYLIASIVVGTLFAYLNYKSTRRRLVFFSVSVLVPIVANWARAYMIVLIGHYSGNELAAGADHLIYGWVFFGLVIFIMFAVGLRWADPSQGSSNFSPNPILDKEAPTSSGYWIAALVISLVSSTPLAIKWIVDRANSAGIPQVAQLHLNGWAEVSPFVDWRPAFSGHSFILNQYFERNGKFAGVYLAYYRNQDYEHKLVSSENVIVKSDDKKWALTRSGSTDILLKGQPLTMTTSELRQLKTDERLRVMSLFWVDDRLTSSGSLAKIFTAMSRLQARGDDSALVVFFTNEIGDETKADLIHFAESAIGEIIESLQRTRGRR